ncbi:hypothetical protein [Rhizobium sp. N122]|nr:hypothetical protein [Rhizobium sp. N122]
MNFAYPRFLGFSRKKAVYEALLVHRDDKAMLRKQAERLRNITDRLML